MYDIDILESIYDYALAQFEDARIALRTANEIGLETGLDVSGKYRDRLDQCKSYTHAAHSVLEYARTIKAAQPKGPFRVQAPSDPTENPDTKRAFDALNKEYYAK